jgi:hypothetical protein
MYIIKMGCWQPALRKKKGEKKKKRAVHKWLE